VAFLAVFAVSAGNYQQSLTYPPQKCWEADDSANKRTAGYSLFSVSKTTVAERMLPEIV
jgi:hypothetical protein